MFDKTLLYFFVKNRYQLVFSITPKGGFLSITSSYLARVEKEYIGMVVRSGLLGKGFRELF